MSVLAIVALAAAVSLVVVCWSLRAVLGGVCAVVAGACAVAGLADGGGLIVGAYAALILGTTLIAVGQAVWSLLDDDTPDGSDTPPRDWLT